jgi:hypothetical protein
VSATISGSRDSRGDKEKNNKIRAVSLNLVSNIISAGTSVVVDTGAAKIVCLVKRV